MSTVCRPWVVQKQPLLLLYKTYYRLSVQTNIQTPAAWSNVNIILKHLTFLFLSQRNAEKVY